MSNASVESFTDTAAVREGLRELAANHRWTWKASAAALLNGLPGAAPDRHPVGVVEALGDADLNRLLADPAVVAGLAAELDDLRALLADRPEVPDVAYFSPEFGISDLVPQYSGGLGVLAGDHLKSASDLGTSLCAVGLFYRGGFFRQEVKAGKQAERYETYTPADFGCTDTGAEVVVPLAGREVHAHVWRLEVGRVALLLLDTDLRSNTASDRKITDRLYSGDRLHRIEQEMILGVGGSRALAALGWHPPVHHLNEGHAGFLILDLLDRHLAEGHALGDAIEAVRPGLVFTTHTPVPAGIDQFEIPMATAHLKPWAERWDLPVAELLALGVHPGDKKRNFNMAALCLRVAGRSSGVSKLHGAVSRDLFHGVPGADRIGSITNGVHARTWVMPRLQDTFDEVLGEGWADGGAEAWTNIDRLGDDAIRELRRAGGRDLQALVAERTDTVIDPGALIIGFARRFATYKRADLLLSQPEALAELLADDERPVQFVFAGKAHPADNEGKALLAHIVAYGSTAAARNRFVFVPDYDMAVARALYAGCDVWLNNPIRPHEASGTSGEKSALNGGLNCSISDGWWDEMADGRNGWTIPASTSKVAATRDRQEAASALTILRDEVVAEYYADGAPWSSAWIARMRDMWRTLGPQVTSGRMVADYENELYGPALADATAR